MSNRCTSPNPVWVFCDFPFWGIGHKQRQAKCEGIPLFVVVKHKAEKLPLCKQCHAEFIRRPPLGFIAILLRPNANKDLLDSLQRYVPCSAAFVSRVQQHKMRK